VESDNAAEAIFSAFSKGGTVAQAIAYATAQGYGNAPYGKIKGWLSYEGDGSVTLQQSSRIGLH